MIKILWFSSLLEGKLPSSKDKNPRILLNQALSNSCSRKCSKKRETFPLINKLHRGNKICIVGAASAGLQMVVDLKSKNVTNIFIFEKTKRVWGKSFDFSLQKCLTSTRDNICNWRICWQFDSFVHSSLIKGRKRLELVDYLEGPPLFL